MRLILGISVLWLALNMASESATALVLPEAIEDEVSASYAATVIGLVSLVALALAALIQPLAGLASDRLRPKWTRSRFIGWSLGPAVVATISFGLADSVATLIGSYVLLLIALSIVQGGLQGFLPEMVSEEKRGLAAGMKGLFDLVGAMLGFAVLGTLIETQGAAPAMLLAAITLVLLFVATLMLVREGNPLAAPGSATRVPGAFSFSSLIKGGFDMGALPPSEFSRLIASRFLFLLGVYAIGRFFLLFLADLLAVDEDQAAQEAGYILATLALVTGFFAPVGGWLADRWGRAPTMRVGAFVGAGGAILLVLAESQASVLLFGSLMALGTALFVSANWATAADLAPEGEEGRSMALASLGTSGAIACAGLFGPVIDAGSAISDGLGFDLLFGISALCMAGSAILVKSPPVVHPAKRRA
jgi:MFS family permease